MSYVLNIHPVALSFFNLEIRWYGLCWALGAYTVMTMLERDAWIRKSFTGHQQETLFFILLLGCLIGAKLGYLAFYTPWSMMKRVALERHGLSFHGAAAGVCISLCLVAYRTRLSFWSLLDRLTLYMPLGLFWGRLGNFLNSELYGYPFSGFGSVIFPYGDALQLPRYPSQLYEALGEGLLLYVMLRLIPPSAPKGTVSAVFAIGYGIIRTFIEQYRQPDAPLIGTWTMGQILSLLLIAFGVVLLFYSYYVVNPTKKSEE